MRKAVFLLVVLGMFETMHCDGERVLKELERILGDLHRDDSFVHPRKFVKPPVEDFDTGFTLNDVKSSKTHILNVIMDLLQKYLSTDTGNPKKSLNNGPPSVPWKKDQSIEEKKKDNAHTKFTQFPSKETENTARTNNVFSQSEKKELYSSLMSDIAELIYTTNNKMKPKREVKERLMENINRLFSGQF